MKAIELLRTCQGQESNGAFAERLGISYSMLMKMYRGIRRPGKKVFRRLAREYPEKKAVIWRVFFAENGDKRHRGETIDALEEVAP